MYQKVWNHVYKKQGIVLNLITKQSLMVNSIKSTISKEKSAWTTRRTGPWGRETPQSHTSHAAVFGQGSGVRSQTGLHILPVPPDGEDKDSHAERKLISDTIITSRQKYLNNTPSTNRKWDHVQFCQFRTFTHNCTLKSDYANMRFCASMIKICPHELKLFQEKSVRHCW